MLLLIVTAVPSPLPTIVVNVAHVPTVEVVDSAWTIAVAVGTILLAAATGGLAFFTYRLAQGTRDSLMIATEALANERAAMLQEQMRHMDGFMPHIALEVTHATAATVKWTLPGVRGGGDVPSTVQVRSDRTTITARNIGPGMALNVRASNTNLPNDQIKRSPIPIAFAANSDPVTLIQRISGLETLMGWTFKYEDAFGREFESRLSDDVRVTSRYTWSGPHKPDYLVTESGERIEAAPGNPIVAKPFQE